jgi:hypothetical protein
MRILSVLASLLLTAGFGVIWAESLAAAPAGAAVADATRPTRAPPPGAGRLPNRTLQCTLSRATNLDLKKHQTVDEIVLEGSHPFTLFLPAVPALQGPPPEAYEPALPVPPATRIVADPDRLARDGVRHFDRVVDKWPDRTELATTLGDGLIHLIIVHPIDVAGGTARLFMTTANQTMVYDLAHVYMGACRVTLGKTAAADQRRPKNRTILGR